MWEEILKQAGLDPAPERASTTRADFLRSQADALPACDFIEPTTLNGQRQYILAVIQAITNLVMDLNDAGCRARHLLRDRDGKFPELMNEILAEAGIKTALTGIRMSRMNFIMER
ncbi:hypothetical protein [Nonomuraea sp. NPDC005692]|uniref:hypothetical protein n=1 Tax=Nonomuraea sp. NPDC005692 TaxID=3157168 RepID=UPI0033C3E4C8